jgi:hypothetical protein
VSLADARYSASRRSSATEPQEADARFVDEAALVQRLLREKYGLQKRALDAFNAAVRKLRRKPKPAAAYIEIIPRAAG